MTCLVTANLLCDVVQSLEKADTELFALMVFANCYILDVALDPELEKACG